MAHLKTIQQIVHLVPDFLPATHCREHETSLRRS